MKAISLHQPWASLIAEREKTIETRFWYTHYRGDLLIVSTKKPKWGNLPLGKALAIVDLYECRPMERKDEKAARCAFEGQWAWLLRNIRPIEPFSVKGSQGFYEVEMPPDNKVDRSMMLF